MQTPHATPLRSAVKPAGHRRIPTRGQPRTARCRVRIWRAGGQSLEQPDAALDTFLQQGEADADKAAEHNVQLRRSLDLPVSRSEK